MENTGNAGRMKYLGPVCIFYTLFYTFCLYKNDSGITFPFLVVGTVLLVWYANRYYALPSPSPSAPSLRTCLRCLLRRGGAFYPAAMILLGISNCMTDSRPLIMLNYGGEFCLLIAFLIHFTSPDGAWNITRHVASMLRAFFGAIGSVFTPFGDFAAFLSARKMKSDDSKKQTGNILIGILIAVPLLFLILWLLSSADAIFSGMMNGFFSGIRISMDTLTIIFMILFAFFGAYCGLTWIQKGKLNEEKDAPAKGATATALTILCPVALVYLLFAGIQIAFLFAGAGLLPKGVTYAEYVHQGFYQLLAVAILNLFLVVIFTEHFEKSRLLGSVLTVICVCTYGLIAVSAYRMILYIGAYDLTFLRLFVLFALSVIALFITGALVCIFRTEFPLFMYCVVVLTCGYLIFSFAHPDYWIARYNLSSGNADKEYFYSLSADAVPAFAEAGALSDRTEDGRALSDYFRDAQKMGCGDFRSFNFSRAKAESLLGT